MASAGVAWGFDGATSNVNIGTGLTLATQGTICFWVKKNYSDSDTNDGYIMDSFSGNRYILAKEGNANNAYLWYLNSNAIFDGPTTLQGLIVGQNVWTHIAMCWDDNLASEKNVIYRNGVRFATANVTAGTTSPQLTLGRRFSNSSFFNGSIAEFGAWSQMLTPGEVWRLGNGWRPELIRNEALLVYGDGRARWGSVDYAGTGSSFVLSNISLSNTPPALYKAGDLLLGARL